MSNVARVKGSERNGVTRSSTVDSVTGEAFVLAPESTTDMQSRSQPAPRTGISTRGAPDAILTGKQEHYLKRELIAQQTKYEITELSHPTALQRFGAPFRSDAGEVSPADSELPLLRYIFVHHVRNFPFLDQAREKEFWQDKLQIFLESFANKHISSSEDRLEETKRKKLAMKAEKLVELMMVSGIPTASGYEERIRFAEMEVVDRGAVESGLIVNAPEGHAINGWDINVAGVRLTSVKRTVRYHQHAEFLVRVRQQGKDERYVGRRFGQFAKLHKQLRLELPGKVLPPLPRKNKSHTGAILGGGADAADDDSISSASTQDTGEKETSDWPGAGIRSYMGFGSSHNRSPSTNSAGNRSARKSSEVGGERVTLYREEQRVSLRAFLRTILQNERIAKSKAMRDFLTLTPVVPNREELEDIEKRKALDGRRIEEQRQFYEIARKRAAELDVHMEKFRRDIVESNGLTKLFKEIRVKIRIADLNPEYQKFAEWLRIEVAATIYHLFLAEDNSPELFAQAKRIHSLIPYSTLKNVIRFANPAAMMKGVLDLFLAQPLGARSLMQRIFGLAINDGIKTTQKAIDAVIHKIDDLVFSTKIKNYTAADEAIKNQLRSEALEEQVDLVVVICRSEQLLPELDSLRIGRVFNAYVAWTAAVESIDEELRSGAELFSHLKQLLKLQTRQRDKAAMLSLIEQPVTLSLFRDLFTIFYEPLVRVYKSANVYSSVTDFAAFADDCVKVITACQRQDVSADPNQTVQAFIDLCARHEEDLYKFIHEVHIHDNGLFDQLMGWLEGILEFLRHGPAGGKLDMNALFQGAVSARQVDEDVAVREIDSLIDWQTARKEWHQDKTRRKMAAEGADMAGKSAASGGARGVLSSADFGLNALDIQDLGLSAEAAELEAEEELREAEEDEQDDSIEAERARRKRMQDALRSRKGEPDKPPVVELLKLQEGFVALLRGVLAG